MTSAKSCLDCKCDFGSSDIIKIMLNVVCIRVSTNTLVFTVANFAHD